jgi:putative transposase
MRVAHATALRTATRPVSLVGGLLRDVTRSPEDHQTWACDFLQLYDVWFRPVFAFFIIDLGSRKVVHVGVTRTPTTTWVAQQLRNATLFGEGPRFLIRDNDDKFGIDFDRAARGAGTRVLRTA